MPKYEPTPEVKGAHAIPHYDPVTREQVPDPKFDAANMQTYIMSLVPTPAILFAFGALVLVVMFLYTQCFQFCCKRKKAIDSSQVEAERSKMERKKLTFKWVCFGLLFVIFITNLFIWLGNGTLTEAFKDLSAALQDLFNVFNSVFRGAEKINRGSKEVTITIDSVCVLKYSTGENTGQPVLVDGAPILNLGPMKSVFQTLGNAAAAVMKTASPILDNVQSAIDQNDGVIPAKDQVVGIIFAAFFVLCILNVVSVYYKSKAYTCILNILNYVILLVLLIVCAVLMILVMFFGDFCMDPTASIKTFFSSPALDYFTDPACSGSNPFQQSLDTLDTTFRTTIPDALEDLKNSLPSDSGLSFPQACTDELSTNIQYIGDGIGLIAQQISCKPIYEVYDGFIHQALCTSGFSGMYQVWGDIYFMAFFYFFLLFFVAYYHNIPTVDASVGVAPASDLEMVPVQPTGGGGTGDHHHHHHHHHHNNGHKDQHRKHEDM